LKKILALIAFSVLLLVPVGTQNAFSAVFIDSFDVSAQDTSPTSLAFNTDGTKMFVLGRTGDDVNEYACTTGFDVSTCAFTVKAGNPFSVAAQETAPQSLAFNTDGTKMFVMGSTGDDVNEYACTTGFDVSTCAFTVKAGNPFSVSAQETIPLGLAFNTDGTKMFVLGTTSSAVNEYACTTGFDVSTCAFTVKAGNPFSIVAQETIAQTLAFSTDGTKMFVLGNFGDNVNEYACTTGFDVSTCGYSGDAERFFIGAQENIPRSLEFSTDGTKMFVMGTGSLAVNEYCLGVPFDVSSEPCEAFPTTNCEIQGGSYDHWDKVIFTTEGAGLRDGMGTFIKPGTVLEFKFPQTNPFEPVHLAQLVTDHLNNNQGWTFGNGNPIKASFIVIIDVEYTAVCVFGPL